MENMSKAIIDMQCVWKTKLNKSLAWLTNVGGINESYN
jgi:hypothetical protein